MEITKTDLKKGQCVLLSGPRGTQEQVYVQGLLSNGQLIVQNLDGQYQIVDREDLLT